MAVVPDLSLPRLIAQRVALHPDRIAVVFEGRSVSYGSLDRQANAIAHQLRQAGARRNARVGLHVERSVAMVAAMLAIHKVGCAYVPLDPAFPRERLDDIVADSGLQFLVHGGPVNLGAVPPSCIDVSVLDVEAAAAESIGTEIDPQDPAYVMYTSGSTGKPKGVVVHHRAVMNFLQSMQQQPGLCEDDVLVAVTTTSFDISVLELFLPLMAGARIVLASKEETFDGERLAQLIAANAATVMQATPATWRMLFISGWRGAPGMTALCGGEMLDNVLAQQLVSATRALWNMYGPTETTVWSTCCRIEDPNKPISVGRPIRNTTLHVLDELLRPVPFGVSGELYIGGDGVALGYTQPALTAARFIGDHLGEKAGARLYRTGDVAELSAAGELRIIGRADEQVKVRGFRVELSDVQKHLLECQGIVQGAVVARPDSLGGHELAAFVVTGAPGQPDGAAIKNFLAERLPDYMVPASCIALDTLPLTPNGKVDKKRLSALAAEAAAPSQSDDAQPVDPAALLGSIVARALGVDRVDPSANLFDLGVNSLRANFIAATFSQRTGTRLSVGEIFEYPSINGLMARQRDRQDLGKVREAATARLSRQRRGSGVAQGEAVAIIGMAGRFPGADNLDEFWNILAEGRDTVTRFTPEEDDPAVEAELRANPNYIRSRGMIRNPQMFDAAFFGVSPNDAAVMDPQQRVFLEIAWEAMENAGYDPDRFDGLVGVYAGMGNNFYYYHNVSTRPNLIHMVGEVQVEIGREKDHIATLVSHKLNLTGPSLSVHTACSTGLVCVDTACQSLLSHQSDMALAGAIELKTPQMSGQLHEPSGIFTGDGRCRPFSHNASGTMFSDGAGVVVLKRLSEALADRDTIHAIIKGSAVNHDGLGKKSYLAPSVKAQMEVIATAQARAGVQPSAVSYIEAHGTATPVGDPIEFQALRNVFEFDDARRNVCALGSVKANLGHPTTAAGVVGVIKTALALEHRQIPPLVNFDGINPNIDIEKSPFYIPTELIDWPRGKTPRLAGVSSFGFCGTNAHVVMEEYRESRPQPASAGRPWLPLLVSAATESALATLTDHVSNAIADGAAGRTVDAAFTLAVGRKRQKVRRFALIGAHGRGRKLEKASASRNVVAGATPDLAFVFPGQGAQYLGMGCDLYETEPVFRQAFDRCADLLHPLVGHDLRKLVLGRGAQPEESAAREQLLNSTQITQPAMFSIEYSLAQLWMSWGLKPSMLVGHSIGEYVCAVLAGVFSLEDGAKIIAARGRLMGSLPRGSMLSVRLPAQDVTPYLQGPALSVAAINGPSLCVVAGPTPEIDGLKKRLDAAGVRAQKLATSHAFHSAMMEPAVAPFLALLGTVAFKAPAMRIISTVTGKDLTMQQAADPSYWARHIVVPVNFSGAIKTLWQAPDCVMLEVGPRSSMSTLAMSQIVDRNRQTAVASLQDSADDHLESQSMATAVGQLWMNRVELDWTAYFGDAEPRRVALPTYPFERKRFWVEPAPMPGRDAPAGAQAVVLAGKACEPGQTEAGEAALDPGAARRRLEDQLRGILEEVSGESMADASATATFFELGLDSLLLTPITYLVKERFGVAVTFRQLLSEFSTLEMLSAHIATHGASKSAAPPVAAAPQAGPLAAGGPDRRGLEANAAQRAILAREKADPALRLAHLESVSIELTGALNREVLQASMKRLLDSHDALRASFDVEAGRMEIAAVGACEPEIRWVDAAADLPAAWVEAEMRRPFDLARVSPVRFAVLALAPWRHSVVMTAHAAVCDGWSLDVMIEELARGYRAAEPGGVPERRADMQFGRYVEWQRERSQAQRADTAAPVCEPKLPTGDAFGAQVRAGATGAQLERIALTVEGRELGGLKEASLAWRCSLFNTIFAAFHAALHRHPDGAHVSVMTPFAGQSAANMPHLVGACADVRPIITTAGTSFPELLAELQDELVSALEQQQDSSGGDGCFAFVHTKRLKAAQLDFGGLGVQYQFNLKADQVFPLKVDVLEFDEKLVIEFAYKPWQMVPSTAKKIFSDYADILRTIAASVEGGQADIPEAVRVLEISVG